MSGYVFVCEGNSDISKLKSLGLVHVYKTDGYFLKEEFINFLKEVEKVRKVILIFDPDKNGHRIEERIASNLSNYEVVRVSYSKAKGRNKLGVAETDRDYLKELLLPYIEEEQDSITTFDLLEINLTDEEKTKLKERFHIRVSNSKTIREDLNTLKLTKADVLKVVRWKN